VLESIRQNLGKEVKEIQSVTPLPRPYYHRCWEAVFEWGKGKDKRMVSYVATTVKGEGVRVVVVTGEPGLKDVVVNEGKVLLPCPFWRRGLHSRPWWWWR